MNESFVSITMYSQAIKCIDHDTSRSIHLITWLYIVIETNDTFIYLQTTKNNNILYGILTHSWRVKNLFMTFSF